MPATVHRIQPLSSPPDAVVAVPGSKSHTNRALICAALANGRSELSGVLFADDTEAMLRGISTLGIEVKIEPGRQSAVIGGGVNIGSSDDQPVLVDVRKSGTTSRFLLPVLAATPGRFILDGHEQLRARPFGPQLDALRALGGEIEGDGLPLSISGAVLHGGAVDVASSISSQYLSGLLLAAPLFEGQTIIRVTGELVSRPYVQLTIATMAAFGADVSVMDGDDGQIYTVDHGAYVPASLALEPDASAASYFFAAAAITGGRVRVDGLGTNTIQGDLRFVDVLERMGAEVTRGPDWTEVAGTGTLRGITVDMSDISDTAQTLAVVATFADSQTEIEGIGFIRFKETDRIGAVVTELGRRGLNVEETDDGMVITPGAPTAGIVDTYDDHRMAMSFALLGLVHEGIEIDNPGCVDKTFPDFFEVLDQLR